MSKNEINLNQKYKVSSACEKGQLQEYENIIIISELGWDLDINK